MNPGSDLSKVVAEKIMGWTEVELQTFKATGNTQLLGVRSGTVATPITGYKAKVNVPAYSSDIGAAWLVVEKTRLLEEHSLYFEGGQWIVEELYVLSGDTSGRVIARAETAPLALCQAALSVLEFESEFADSPRTTDK